MQNYRVTSLSTKTELGYNKASRVTRNCFRCSSKYNHFCNSSQPFSFPPFHMLHTWHPFPPSCMQIKPRWLQLRGIGWVVTPAAVSRTEVVSQENQLTNSWSKRIALNCLLPSHPQTDMKCVWLHCLTGNCTMRLLKWRCILSSQNILLLFRRLQAV